MKTGHIFETFVQNFAGERVLIVEKDTKEEVAKIIRETNREESRHVFFIVNADVLSVENLYELAIQSQHMIQKFSQYNLSLMFIQHPALENCNTKLPEFILNNIEEQGYLDMKDTVSHLTKDELISFIVHVNERVRQIREQVNSQFLFYQQTLNKAKEKEPINLGNWNNKYKFYLEKDSLLSVYEDCFNLFKRISMPFVSMNPEFQGKVEWPIEKKKEFIQNIVENKPFGVLYVNTQSVEVGDGYGYLLLKGKEKILALHDFIMDGFPITILGQEVYYSQAPQFFNSVFKNTEVMLYNTNLKTKEEIMELYNFLNQTNQE